MRIGSKSGRGDRRVSKPRWWRLASIVMGLALSGLLFGVVTGIDGGESSSGLEGGDADASSSGSDGADSGVAVVRDGAEVELDSSGGEPLYEIGQFRIPEEDLEDHTDRIEDPTLTMEHFYSRLLDVARREEGAVARILLFSVSLNGSDRVTSTMRHALQSRFGDAGKGFVPIAPGWGAQEHQDVEWTHSLWRTARVNTGLAPGGLYGLGGVLATNSGIRSQSTFSTVDSGPSNRAVSLFRLFYRAWPEGGEVVLQVDDDDPQRLSTRSPTPEDRVFDVPVTTGPHRLAVSAGSESGSLRLYGIVMEGDGPGVVVDAMMYLGANVGMMPNFDADHLEAQSRMREPDLIIFWLGANDVYARAFTHEWMVENYGGFIASLRGGRPEASCMVMSVLDKGEERNGRVLSRAKVPRVVEAQEETARDQGCAFFNLYEATGGHGSVSRWYRANPRMVGPDLLHLTEAGAHHVGATLNGALLRGYDDFLASSQSE